MRYYNRHIDTVQAKYRLKRPDATSHISSVYFFIVFGHIDRYLQYYFKICKSKEINSKNLQEAQYTFPIVVKFIVALNWPYIYKRYMNKNALYITCSNNKQMIQIV